MKLYTRLWVPSLVLLIFIFSCQKEIKKTITPSDQLPITNQTTIAKAYLQTKIILATDSDKIHLEAVKDHINWADAELLSFSGSNSLLIASYNSYIQFHNPTAGDKVVFVMDRFNNIKSVGIVEFNPSSGYKAGNTAALIKNVYLAREDQYEGTFSVYDIYQRFAFQLQYSSGKISSFSKIQDEKSLAGIPVADQNKAVTSSSQKIPDSETGQNCTNWYLNTTFYYSDGSTTETSQYLYTTCSGEEGLNPGGGGGGGGTISTHDLLVAVDTIYNNLTNPCLVSAKDDITNNQYKNFLTQLYQKFFTGAGASINLTFSQNSSITYDGAPAVALSLPPAGNNWTIQLNPTFANTASQQFLAAAILHELMHAYTNIAQTNNPTNTTLGTQLGQHEFMMETFTPAAITLLESAFGLSAQDATALALSGYGDLWANSTDSAYMVNTFGITAANANTIANNYFSGTAGTVCH
jgi:hypothetical protein